MNLKVLLHVYERSVGAGIVSFNIRALGCACFVFAAGEVGVFVCAK